MTANNKLKTYLIISDMDWKEQLAALQGTLPSGTAEQEPQQPTAARKGPRPTLRLVMERKGRGGKTATIIEGFPGTDDELKALATRLKQQLGVGGSARGGEILIQGDCRARLRELLAPDFIVKG